MALLRSSPEIGACVLHGSANIDTFPDYFGSRLMNNFVKSSPYPSSKSFLRFKKKIKGNLRKYIGR